MRRVVSKIKEGIGFFEEEGRGQGLGRGDTQVVGRAGGGEAYEAQAQGRRRREKLLVGLNKPIEVIS